jgi:hypothetical protein
MFFNFGNFDFSNIDLSGLDADYPVAPVEEVVSLDSSFNEADPFTQEVVSEKKSEDVIYESLGAVLAAADNVFKETLTSEMDKKFSALSSKQQQDISTGDPLAGLSGRNKAFYLRENP